MQERRIAVRISAAQQVILELEIQTLFGLQVDDRFDAEDKDEKILLFVVTPELMESYERLVGYFEQKEDACVLHFREVIPPHEERDDEEHAEELKLSAEDAYACAEAACATLSRSWVQNVFGEQVTDVLFEALKLYMDSLSRPGKQQPSEPAPPDHVHLLQEGVSVIIPMILQIRETIVLQKVRATCA